MKADRFGLKTLFHVIVGIAILLVSQLISSLLFDLLYFFAPAESFYLILVRLIISPLMIITISFLLTYIYIVKILKMRLADFRICKPKNSAVWILCAAALPLSVSGFFIFLTPGIFAAGNLGSEQNIFLIINAALGVCLCVGITEELIFRGFIMHLLEVRWNKYVAIIAPSILFGILHLFNIENPNGVDILLLLIAGTSVGILFSMIAYQSGSVWAAAIVHGIWNMIIIGRILEISIEPRDSIFSYTLTANSPSLTGGAFGIESSVPATIGYGIIIFLAWFLKRKESANDDSV
jgi:membrane protease YdiL (CAAX protease family)